LLIHAAAGGVGLAAVQYAQRIGARIIATCSDGKREYLQSLGVVHIASSRDADRFVKEVRDILGPNGFIDVVLNSLGSDFISNSLKLMSPGGRFVEIGKREIWSPKEVKDFRPDIDYHILALDTIIQENPDLFQALLHRVCEDVDNGYWTALPLQTFDFVSDYKNAFRHLRDGKIIGKTVLKVRPLVIEAAADSIGEGAYVITGGLGGLGLLTAKVLVQMGAKRLVLVSRSGRVSYEGQGLEANLAWLQEESGADVQVMRCDVSEEAAVERMLSEVRLGAGGIEGIVHSAGVLRDALIRGGAAAAECKDVWAAKAHSAWLLHKHSVQDKLKVFLTFSSISTATGNPGQAAYAAANSYLITWCRSECGKDCPA